MGEPIMGRGENRCLRVRGGGGSGEWGGKALSLVAGFLVLLPMLRQKMGQIEAHHQSLMKVAGDVSGRNDRRKDYQLRLAGKNSTRSS